MSLKESKFKPGDVVIENGARHYWVGVVKGCPTCLWVKWIHGGMGAFIQSGIEVTRLYCAAERDCED